MTVWAILSMLGVAGSIRILSNRKLSASLVLLCGSSILIPPLICIELLDVRPECPTIAFISLLMWRSLAWKGRNTDAIMLGFLTGMLVGARPTNLILAGAAPLVCFTGRETGRRTKWQGALLGSAGFIMTILLFFPHYLMYHETLFHQLDTYYFNCFPPAGPGVIGVNALLAATFMLLSLPGPLLSTGLMIGLTGIMRGMNRKLLLFSSGFLPFLIAAIRSSEFQSRHLTVMAPLLAVISCLGFIHLAGRSRIMLLTSIVALGSINIRQSAEIWTEKLKGGLAAAIDEASLLDPVAVLGEGPFYSDELYGGESRTSWPLRSIIRETEPEISSDLPDDRPVLLITDEPAQNRPGWSLVLTTGGSADWKALIKSENNVAYADLIAYMRYPWLWRDWGPVSIYSRL